MGYLTTFTVYNDGCHDIPTRAKEFADKIHDACMSHKTKSFSLGNNSNLVKCQKTRHADDHTIYAHAGNTLTEMNPYSEDTKEAMVNNPEFFKKMLDFMSENVKELKKLYKESQKKERQYQKEMKRREQERMEIQQEIKRQTDEEYNIFLQKQIEEIREEHQNDERDKNENR